jgi:[ribosomal protein S5]-alanine N-acetyltransferase
MINKDVISGNLYNLVPFGRENITEDYIDWLNDPQVNKFLEIRHINQSISTATDYVDKFYKDSEAYIWGIYTQEALLIGTVNLNSINRHHNAAELGLMVGNKDYWGKLASEEAISLVLNFAFHKLKLNRVTGGTYSTNLGMIFTYKKLGFTREGVMRESFIEDQKYIDGYRWGILSNEWKNG